MTQQTFSAPRSRRRILLVASLAVGTIVSIVLMTAAPRLPALAWAALAVALLAGFLATWAALVEFREWRERASQAATQARAEERERTQELHATQRRVLGAVHARVTTLSGDLGATKRSLAEVTVKYGEASLQVSRLRGDNEGLRIENDGLRAVGQELWAENRDLRGQTDAAGAEGADVLALPRRRLIADGGEWEAELVPTVVDLDLQRLTAPFVSELRQRQAN